MIYCIVLLAHDLPVMYTQLDTSGNEYYYILVIICNEYYYNYTV